MSARRLLKGSFLLLIAFGLFNLFNFLYQFAMARMLSVADYGVLASLFSIIYIFAVFSESIQTIVTKYVVLCEGNIGKIHDLVVRSFKKSSRIAVLVFLIYLVISVAIAFLLKIPYTLLAINGGIVFLMFILPITRGVMQGQRWFVSLGGNLVLESALKLVFGVLLVFAGWSVYGAIGGFVIGGAIAFAFSIVPLKKIFTTKREHMKTQEIYDYAKPAITITGIIVLFYSIDVLIAKFLFDPEIAGAYALASLLGKIILWASIPIGKAMFPLSAESNDKKDSRKLFLIALCMVSAIAISLLIIFELMADNLMILFAGKSVPAAAEIIVYVGIAFSCIAISNLILLYKLSKGRVKKYSLLILCNLIEIVVLLLFSSTIKEFAVLFAGLSAVLLAASILLTR